MTSLTHSYVSVLSPDGIEGRIKGCQICLERFKAHEKSVLNGWRHPSVHRIVSYSGSFTSYIIEGVNNVDSFDDAQYSTNHDSQVEYDGTVSRPLELIFEVHLFIRFSQFFADWVLLYLY